MLRAPGTPIIASAGPPKRPGLSCVLQACKTLTEQIAALKGSPAPLQAAQHKTAELEEDKAKFHLHISSLEVGSILQGQGSRR